MKRLATLSEQLRARAQPAYWLFVLTVLLAGLALRSPGLHASLYADDWDHYAMQQGIYPVPQPAWNMFNFVPNDDGARRALMQSGRIPWWASPTLHLAVFRPIASLLVYFDYAILDGQHHPERMHLHSLCWWVALILGVAKLFELVLPKPIAALGVLIYAADDAHVLPSVWAANRSELVAVAFVIWAICAHVGSRTRSSKALSVLSPVLAALGMFSGEHGLAPLAYLAAYSLYDLGSFARRAARLLPVALVAVTYTLVRSTLGYGVAGSGFYIEPTAEPGRFLVAASTRIPALLGNLLFSVPELWRTRIPGLDSKPIELVVPKAWLSPRILDQTQIVLGIIAGLLTVAAVWWFQRPASPARPRALSWLLVGALGSLLPLSGTTPMCRMTVAPAIAFDAALGYLLWRTLECVMRSQRPAQRRGYGLAAAALAVFAIVLPGSRTKDGSDFLDDVSRKERRRVEEADYGLPTVAGTHLIVLCAKDLATQFSIPYVLHGAEKPMPLSARMLTPIEVDPQIVSRIDRNTLDVEFPEELIEKPFAVNPYRTPTELFHVGQKLASTLFDVTVLEMRDREPSHLRFVFHTSLDDPQLVFLYPTKHRLRRLRIPRIGVSLEIPAPAKP